MNNGMEKRTGYILSVEICLFQIVLEKLELTLDKIITTTSQHGTTLNLGRNGNVVNETGVLFVKVLTFVVRINE